MGRANLECECGAVSWEIHESDPRLGIRYVCHCDDCQAYAQFLGAPDRLLDSHAGTDAYQLPASRFQIARGSDQLACVQVTSRPLLRWYCISCRTPVANTYHTSKLSFLSLPIPRTRSSEVDQVLGPSSGHVWTKFGRGDLSDVRQVNIPAMLWRMFSRIVSARWTGDYRSNPLFDPSTAAPIAPPKRLAAAQRSELDEKAKASRGA